VAKAQVAMVVKAAMVAVRVEKVAATAERVGETVVKGAKAKGERMAETAVKGAKAKEERVAEMVMAAMVAARAEKAGEVVAKAEKVAEAVGTTELNDRS
jgi:hypothetical protein